jgi:uncharacterized membrane protein
MVYKGRDGAQLGVNQSLFPPSQTIDALSRHYPDAVKEILEMAKREQEHTHGITMSQLETDERQASRDHRCRITGMWFGFVICASLLGAGVFLIHTGKGWGGYPAVVIAFITLVGCFLGSKPAPPQG